MSQIRSGVPPLYKILHNEFNLFKNGVNQLLHCCKTVSIVTMIRAGQPGSDFQQQQEFILSLPLHPDWLWHPPRLLLVGNRSSFPGNKVAVAWSWPLTLSSAGVKNAWSYTSTPPYVFMAWCL